MADEKDPKQIEQKVIDIVVEQLDVSRDQVTMDTRFVDDLGADSLDIAELTMEFEDEFDLDIPENEEAVQTVGDAVKYIQDQLAKKQSA
jgi:acyl carrier protein